MQNSKAKEDYIHSVEYAAGFMLTTDLPEGWYDIVFGEDRHDSVMGEVTYNDLCEEIENTVVGRSEDYGSDIFEEIENIAYSLRNYESPRASSIMAQVPSFRV